jgi:NTP pyrophosphatase (non-canonical NTP hydrolase)
VQFLVLSREFVYDSSMDKQPVITLEELIKKIWAADAVTDADRLTFECVGLAAESGELLNQLKKHHFYRNQDRRVELFDELCDVYYHVNSLCKTLGVTREELEQQTIEKHNRSLAKIQAQQASSKRGD